MSLSQRPVSPEQFAALPPEFRTLLQAVIDYYEARIAALETELATVRAELEATKTKKTPRNSSLPPSTEHPHAKPATKRGKSGRKPGGKVPGTFMIGCWTALPCGHGAKAAAVSSRTGGSILGVPVHFNGYLNERVDR
jgi:hypothetical protein